MPHELYGASEKKSPIQIPEWEESPAEKKAKMEDRIRELECIFYPEGTNIITLPEGFEENDLKKMEEEYHTLKKEHKKLYGIF